MNVQRQPIPPHPQDKELDSIVPTESNPGDLSTTYSSPAKAARNNQSPAHVGEQSRHHAKEKAQQHPVMITPKNSGHAVEHRHPPEFDFR
jgi:hypothetical protein